VKEKETDHGIVTLVERKFLLDKPYGCAMKKGEEKMRRRNRAWLLFFCVFFVFASTAGTTELYAVEPTDKIPPDIEPVPAFGKYEPTPAQSKTFKELNAEVQGRYTLRLPKQIGQSFRLNLARPQDMKIVTNDTINSVLQKSGFSLGLAPNLKNLKFVGEHRIGGPDLTKMKADPQDPKSPTLQELYDAAAKKKGTAKVNEFLREGYDVTAEDLIARNGKGFYIYMYNQTHEGKLIEGARIVVRGVEGKEPNQIRGVYYQKINVTNTPVISGEEATRRAVADMRFSPGDITGTADLEEVIFPYINDFRHAYRMTIEIGFLRFYVVVDAESGETLKRVSLTHPAEGKVPTFKKDPSSPQTTQEIKNFGSPTPSGSQYKWILDGGHLKVVDEADTDAELLSSSSTYADWDVSPWNVATAPDYDDFRQVNIFGILDPFMTYLRDLLGFKDGSGDYAVEKITAHAWYGVLCNAYSLTGHIRLYEAGSDCNHSTLDGSIIVHEYGHRINDAAVGLGGGSLIGALHEGLADYWAASWYNQNSVADWYGAPRIPAPPISGECDGDNLDFESGRLPRKFDCEDVFPGHRDFGTGSHADGQMIGRALWDYRQELVERPLSFGKLLADLAVLHGTINLSPGGSGSTDKSLYEKFQDMLQGTKDAILFTVNNKRDVNKLEVAFARAGITEDQKIGAINIMGDDYLDPDDTTPPSFEVWTGRMFHFVGNNAVVTGPGDDDFNTRYIVEMALDPGFSPSYSSGSLTATSANVTYTLDASTWNTIRGDTANKRLYYRVITHAAAGPTVDRRESNDLSDPDTVPFAGLKKGPCECSVAQFDFIESNFWQEVLYVTVALLPLVVIAVWRYRLRKLKDA
jgi:hypothetical protein